MAEYISREAAINAMCRLCSDTTRDKCSIQDICNHVCRLEAVPAADVRPVVRGKWEEDWETGCSTCSACDESYLWEDYDGVGEWNYCPNCGAVMEES